MAQGRQKLMKDNVQKHWERQNASPGSGKAQAPKQRKSKKGRRG